MVHHSSGDKTGNLRYHLEHTKPVEHEGGLLPKSQQFADIGRTLGVQSRGYAFTGESTESHNHDAAIHSGSSLINDPRQSNEYFVEDRSGARAVPQFKGSEFSLQTTGQNPDGTAFTVSKAAPPEQGGEGPTWWDRIKTNFRNGQTTQSTNLPTKPPEKFQIGLRSSNVKPAKADQKFPNGRGPVGAGTPVGAHTQPFPMHL
jgi:hypothetical protein